MHDSGVSYSSPSAYIQVRLKYNDSNIVSEFGSNILNVIFLISDIKFGDEANRNLLRLLDGDLFQSLNAVRATKCKVLENMLKESDVTLRVDKFSYGDNFICVEGGALLKRSEV